MTSESEAPIAPSHGDEPFPYRIFTPAVPALAKTSFALVGNELDRVGKYPLDQHPELHGTSSRPLNACESTRVNLIRYGDPTRSVSFPTKVNDVLTRFARSHIGLCRGQSSPGVERRSSVWALTGSLTGCNFVTFF